MNSLCNDSFSNNYKKKLQSFIKKTKTIFCISVELYIEYKVALYIFEYSETLASGWSCIKLLSQVFS